MVARVIKLMFTRSSYVQQNISDCLYCAVVTLRIDVGSSTEQDS